ncbi:MAG: membrane protein [Sulfurovum sp. PC08-66]|nr:MAG: membrane protein [Sulfurovum sp. PC08-66]
MSFIMIPILQLLHTLITLYIIVVFVSAILSFVRPDPYNPIVQTIYKLTEPVFDFVRKKIPFVVIGGIDLSPLVILLGLQFIDNIIVQLLH